MNILTTYIVVALAALIHASFQLSISTFTLMSGHHLGRTQSYKRLNRLIGGFLLGAVTMTILLLSTIGLFVIGLAENTSSLLVLATACGLCFGVGVAVWLFYYPRKSKGTTLWLPRRLATYVTDRSQATKSSSEAFGLGLSSVFGELAFTIAPIFVAATALVPHDPYQQLVGIGLYAALSSLFLVVIIMLVGSGHKISRIQQWREKNKGFLQFASGGALLILGAFIYAYYVYPFAVGVGL